MGRARWGTSGGFQGKNGANIGRWSGGENIVGPLPHISNVPATTAQVNVRIKFGLVGKFLGGISPLIKIGFEEARERNQSAFSAAMGYNYRNAVTGVAPNFTIDYPDVLFSKGPLTVPYNAEVAATVDAQLDFSWLPLAGLKDKATDLVTFVVYNPAKQLFVVVVNAAPRSAGSYDMALPANFSGDVVHAYTSVTASAGKLVSNSYYLGSITVQ